MSAIIYGILCPVVLLLAWMVLSKLDLGWRVYYNPVVVLGGATLLYTVTPWIAEPKEDNSVLAAFALIQLVGILGMCSGGIVAHILFRPRPDRTMTVVRPKYGPKTMSLVMTVVLALYVVVYHQYFGGLQSIFRLGYRNITESQLDSTEFRFIWINLVLYSLPAALTAGYISKVSRPTWYVVSAVYLILLTASGTRNYILMYLGGLLLVATIMKPRVGYPKFASGVAVLLLIFTVIGLYRNFGFERRYELLDLYKAEGWGS